MKFCPNCSTLLKIVDSIDDLQSQTGGGGKYTELIQTLIQSDSLPDTINISNISEITQSPEYKNLSIEDQELVYNKIQEILPKNKKKPIDKKTTSTDTKLIYYVCVDCSFYKELQPKTLIYSETKNKLDTNIPDLSYMVHNSILPRTTQYTCINDECSSHADGGIAVYMRYNNKIINICETCKYQWT